MRENIHYQRLKIENLETFRSLNKVFAKAFEDEATHLSNLPSNKYLTKLLSKNHFIAIAAMTDDQVVGGLVAYVLDKYEQERSEIYIYDLAVDENFRRQGIARGLIKTLQELAKDFGAWVIFVQADRQDEPAVKLYESLGVKEEPLHFDLPVKD